MSQPEAQCQYEGGEYKPEVVEVELSKKKSRDPEKDG